MRTLPKWKLDNSTLLFFLFSFCCGYFKQTLFIFFIVLWHELGHILAIKICGYRFLRVDIYPFGGMTRMEKPINSSINKEIFISLAGIFFQILLFFPLILLKNYSYLSINNYQFLIQTNWILLIFNLIPIIPLDGSITIHSLLEKKFPYEKAFSYYEIISILSLFLFCFINVYFSIDNYFICGVLWTQFFLWKKNKKYWIHRFYLERFLKEYPYKKIENETDLDIHKLKKETLHFFKENQRYIHEKELLKEYFEKKRPFF